MPRVETFRVELPAELVAQPEDRQALGAGAVFDDSGPFAAHGVFGYAAFFSFLVWILVASVVLVVGKRGFPRATAAF